MGRFFIILGLLITYTMFKAWQMWPHQRLLAVSLVIPIFAIMVGWMFIYRSNPGLFHASWFIAFVFIGGVVMGIWTIFFVFSVPVDLFAFIAGIFQKVSSPHDPDRRAFISNSFRMSILGASAAFGALGMIEVFRGPRIKETNIRHSKLPSNLHGLKIAQISDLHVSPAIRKGYVQDVVEKTNALNPDLIFITGDLADGKVAEMREHLLPLQHLKSKYGVYYVVGNHEYYWHASEYTQLISSFGFTPLMNENRIITVNGVQLMIAGVTDPVGKEFNEAPDAKKAMGNSSISDFKILLAHRPDMVLKAEPVGFDLQFSGHTHGGQFFPFNLLFPLVHKYYHGLNQHGNMQVYVNAGTGYWGPPNRFGIPSEISSIILSSS